MQETFFPLKVAASVAKRQFFDSMLGPPIWRISGQSTLEWQQWSTGRCGGRGLGVFVPWHSGNFRPYSFIPVVPRQAGGGSFRRESTYKPRKEFACRMCAGRRWWDEAETKVDLQLLLANPVIFLILFGQIGLATEQAGTQIFWLLCSQPFFWSQVAHASRWSSQVAGRDQKDLPSLARGLVPGPPAWLWEVAFPPPPFSCDAEGLRLL